jgi:hypothetical protein
MFITKKHLSRRTFLLGSFGATVALPMLDAMVPALTAQSRTAANRPLRFGAIYQPNGIFPDTWHPDTPGADFEFKQPMKPLEPFRDNIVTVSKLQAPAGSVHLGASAAFLNGVGPVGKGGDFSLIMSQKTLDQHIADKWAGDTPLRSIELGTEDMGTSSGACDGFPCVFFNALSWRDDTSPLPVVVNPRVTFERMFGETGTTQQRLSSLKRKQSLLDSVLAETNKLRADLGGSDKAILDEYMANIRDVESMLDRMESRVANLTDAETPIGVPEAFDDHMSISYNLMHLAFQGDISRVFTFLLGHEASTRSYGHIGIPEAHHSISHHANNPETMAKYAKIATYHVAKIAEFCQKMKDTPDGDGNLLDHSLLYFGSGMSNGNVHDRKNPPALLVGGANGRMRGNMHYVADDKNEEPVANLLLGISDVAGCELDAVGYSWDRFRLLA